METGIIDFKGAPINGGDWIKSHHRRGLMCHVEIHNDNWFAVNGQGFRRLSCNSVQVYEWEKTGKNQKECTWFDSSLVKAIINMLVYRGNKEQPKT